MKGKDAPTISLFKEGNIPTMPPGYYSGDKPNPNLRSFVEKHIDENPYDPETDDYAVPAFNQPIQTTKATAIYNMHSYHQGKKPHDAIQQYIRHYTKPRDLVLDPFCGSGSTALAALMEGRKAIAIDRSPAATFITKNYCTPVDPNELQEAFEELKEKVKPEMDWLYGTRCDRCGGEAVTAYTVYSQVFQCPRCLEKVPLFDCIDAQSQTAKGKPKKIKACPHCHARGITEEISTRSERFGSIPVLVSYLCESGCKPKRDERRHNDPDPKKREYFEKYDLGKIREIEEKEIPYWYPAMPMIKGRETCVKRNLEAQGVYKVSDLFTKRNLWALAIMNNIALELVDIYDSDAAKLALTGSMLHLSKMSHHKEGGGGIMVGTYYLPQVFKERNTLKNYYDKIEEILTAKTFIILVKENRLLISTQSCCRLKEIPSVAIDYIFTDPPYADNVQYGELNFVWEAWLGFDTNWHDEEIIVNEVRGKTEADWEEMMKQAMAECYRVLKPGRWLSLCYHDTSEGTWALVQDIMAEVGFVVDRSDTALFIDAGQKSYNQLTADKVTKRDLVINFRKPKPGELSSQLTIFGDEDEQTFAEKAHAVIRDYLTAHPGSTKDRIYDEVVSHMVRAGRMEAHNFEELLGQVAEEVSEPIKKNLLEDEPPDLFGSHTMGRWYLRESELDAFDSAEQEKEDQAAESIANLISARLSENPAEEGLHYNDLFEHYIYAIKDKPRRHLVDWLLDYFYKTPQGTYRLPLSEEEERLKAEGRAKGTGRRIKRYLSYLTQGLGVPESERPSDATLAEWIRHCKRSGLYEQGKLLYEKGGLNPANLSEEQQAAAEEDYEICAKAKRKGK